MDWMGCWWDDDDNNNHDNNENENDDENNSDPNRHSPSAAAATISTLPLFFLEGTDKDDAVLGWGIKGRGDVVANAIVVVMVVVVVVVPSHLPRGMVYP